MSIALSPLARSNDVIALTDITYRQLDYWCRTGVLEVAYPAKGPGTARLFNWSEIRLVRVVQQLANLGLSDEPLRAAASKLRSELARMEQEGWAFVSFDSEVVRVGYRQIEAVVAVRTFPDGESIRVTGAGYLVRVTEAI